MTTMGDDNTCTGGNQVGVASLRILAIHMKTKLKLGIAWSKPNRGVDDQGINLRRLKTMRRATEEALGGRGVGQDHQHGVEALVLAHGVEVGPQKGGNL